MTMTDAASDLPADRVPADPAPVGLVYVNDTMPGILRRRRGQGFSYHHQTAGRTVTAPERARIRQLAVPPAYRDVWICGEADGHLQATGLDERGRKQYRYHPLWHSWRSGSKYAQLAEFGLALGRLRRRVQHDLRADAGDLDFSLAALTRLIDRTCLRVGSHTYARDNRTFGASTLLSRHLTLTDGIIRLRFRAKGGKRVTHTLRDSRLHRILQHIEDLPGRNLFSYIAEDGSVRPVGSAQVNAYVATASGLAGTTAKTFRTWGGSLAAFAAAREADGRLTVKHMAEAAAALLANTPQISRSAYIHPQILALAELDAATRATRLAAVTPQGDRLLRAEERHMLGFLLSSA